MTSAYVWKILEWDEKTAAGKYNESMITHGMVCHCVNALVLISKFSNVFFRVSTI